MGLKTNKFWREVYEQTNKIFNWLFVLSGVFLSFILTVNYSVIVEYDTFRSTDYQVSIPYAIIALLLMIPVYWHMAYKRNFVKRIFESFTVPTGWTALFFTIMIFKQMYEDTQRNYDYIIEGLKDLNSALDWEAFRMPGFYIVLPVFCVLALFALFVFVSSFLFLFYTFFQNFIKKADRKEETFAKIAFAVSFILICIFYSASTLQWSSLDLIYQTDGSFVYDNYYPVFSYGYDFDFDIGNGGIRHPLATLCMYPIYVLVSLAAKVLFWIPNIQAILYAVIQSVMMIVTVIILKRMIKSDWIYWIYLVSFPFLFFTVFVEKYQISTLLMVMFAYSVVTKEEKETQRYFLFAASGMMITSALLGLFYGVEKDWKARFKEYGELAGKFLIVLVASGRIGYLLNFWYLLGHNFLIFNGQNLFSALERGMSAVAGLAVVIPQQIMVNVASVPLFQGDVSIIPVLLQRLCAFFHLLASCFVPVPYEAGEIFYWRSIYGELNLLGVLIFVIVIAVFIRHRKEKIVQIFAVWILWALIQFGLIGFSAGCSPLFSLYFSWAVIPMVMIGAKDILKKTMHQFLVYGAMIVIMIGTNYAHLEDLYDFMIVTEHDLVLYEGTNEKQYYCGDGVLDGRYTGMATNMENGHLYWFEAGVMAKNHEVYDAATDGWYWFEEDGKMAVDKDVFMPTTGKWVRYDEDGRMVKGEDYRDGEWYRFDEKTGAMIHGEYYDEEGNYYYYDDDTGILIEGGKKR